MAFLDKFGGIVASGSFHNTFDDGTFGNCDGLPGHGAGDFRGARNLDPALCNDVAIDMAGHDNVARLDSSDPVSVLGQRDRALKIAVAINYTSDLKVATAGYQPGNFAAFID